MRARAAGLSDWPGFDLLSDRPNEPPRCIEVKGRADTGEVFDVRDFPDLEVLPDEHFEDARDGLVLGDGFWSPHLRAVPYFEEHRHSHMGLVFLRHKRLLKRRDPVYVNDVAGIA